MQMNKDLTNLITEIPNPFDPAQLTPELRDALRKVIYENTKNSQEFPTGISKNSYDMLLMLYQEVIDAYLDNKTKQEVLPQISSHIMIWFCDTPDDNAHKDLFMRLASHCYDSLSVYVHQSIADLLDTEHALSLSALKAVISSLSTSSSISFAAAAALYINAAGTIQECDERRALVETIYLRALTVLIIYYYLNYHSTNWISFNRQTYLNFLKVCNVKVPYNHQRLLNELHFHFGIDMRVVGSNNPIPCINIPWAQIPDEKQLPVLSGPEAKKLLAELAASKTAVKELYDQIYPALKAALTVDEDNNDEVNEGEKNKKYVVDPDTGEVVYEN